VIASFADRDTETVWRGFRARKFPHPIAQRGLVKLRILDSAKRLEDLRSPPGNRLEALRGDRTGQHSIRVNDQWRICFRWHEGSAHDVEIVDYH
jgi:proteic killer suppression protein